MVRFPDLLGFLYAVKCWIRVCALCLRPNNTNRLNNKKFLLHVVVLLFCNFIKHELWNDFGNDIFIFGFHLFEQGLDNRICNYLFGCDWLDVITFTTSRLLGLLGLNRIMAIHRLLLCESEKTVLL